MKSSRPKLLVVEDSPEFQLLIRSTLAEIAEVHVVTQLKDAERELRSKQHDLVLLDLMLPDGFRFDLLKKKFPFPSQYVVLSARSDSGDKVFAFKNGILDYIVKPFDVYEFQARLQALLERARDLSSLNRSQREMSFEGFTLTPSTLSMACADGSDVRLTQKEFLLLQLLFRQSSTVHRETILNEVWGAGVYVQPRAIDALVSRLRKKLTNRGLDIINEYGFGYAIKKKTEPLAGETGTDAIISLVAQQIGGDEATARSFCELLLKRCSEVHSAIQHAGPQLENLGRIIHELAGTLGYIHPEMTEKLEAMRVRVESAPMTQDDFATFVRVLEETRAELSIALQNVPLAKTS
jgi:DNA-binding response OmpR family regulator